MDVTRWMLIGMAAGVLGGCAGAEKPPASDAAVALDSRQRPDERAEALRRGVGGTEKEAVLKAARAIVWDIKAPPAVRVEAMRVMLAEPSNADARELGKKLLPREQDRDLVHLLAQSAVDRSWDDYVPALVRSLSREIPGVKDQDRAEFVAITRLSKGQDAAGVVFGVFANPPEVPSHYGLDWRQRCRADAWSVLARLDPDASKRAALLAASDSSDPVVRIVARANRELGIMPANGGEIDWLAALSTPQRESWWSESRVALARLNPSQREGLALRHVEAVRWASAHDAEALASDRAALLSQIGSVLATRRRVPRSWGGAAPAYSEGLAANEARLSWGDALVIRLVDRAIREAGVVESLFTQAELDHKDRTTEYGGLLIASVYRGGSGSGFQAALYPPRPGERRGDHQFIASQDMIASGDRALVHYHFHVQQTANEEYAGPSLGDLEYAERFGRACVVLTSLGEKVLGVDYYQPGRDGPIVLDLGTIERGASR